MLPSVHLAVATLLFLATSVQSSAFKRFKTPSGKHTCEISASEKLGYAKYPVKRNWKRIDVVKMLQQSHPQAGIPKDAILMLGTRLEPLDDDVTLEQAFGKALDRCALYIYT